MMPYLTLIGIAASVTMQISTSVLIVWRKNAPGHWLIKRFLDGGKVTNSTTETTAPKDTKSGPETSLANEDTNIESEKEIPGAFTSGNKATAEECSDVSRTCNSCVNSKALLFPSMLIDGTDSFKLSMKQTLLPVPVMRIMTYACLVTSG